MKRIFLMAVTTLAAAALAAGAGAAGDAKGPACTNVVDGIAGYRTDTRTVTVELTLGAPACATATYLVEIKNFAGTTTLVSDLTPESTSGTTMTFVYTFSSASAPSDGVCVVAQTSIKKHLIDRAPDGDGCFPVVADESPASGFH
jgi:hypothetical protein